LALTLLMALSLSAAASSYQLTLVKSLVALTPMLASLVLFLALVPALPKAPQINSLAISPWLAFACNLNQGGNNLI
jgi:hypothetical protein